MMEADIEKAVSLRTVPLFPIVEIALHTGMRKGEILGLKWDQIRNGFIYLEGGMVKSGNYLLMTGRPRCSRNYRSGISGSCPLSLSARMEWLRTSKRASLACVGGGWD